MEPLLNSQNYKKGFLIDEEWMGGVSEEPEGFSAFIINHLTGEYLGYTLFDSLDAALHALAHIPRKWAFESNSGCGGQCSQGGGGCGGGGCGGGGCGGKGKCLQS